MRVPDKLQAAPAHLSKGDRMMHDEPESGWSGPGMMEPLFPPPTPMVPEPMTSMESIEMSIETEVPAPRKARKKKAAGKKKSAAKGKKKGKKTKKAKRAKGKKKGKKGKKKNKKR